MELHEVPDAHVRALHLLAQRARFVDRALGVGDATLQECAHRPERRNPEEIEGLAQLPGELHACLRLAVHRDDVAPFEGGAERAQVARERRVPVTRRHRQPRDPFGDGGPLLERVRSPEHDLAAREHAGQRRRIAERFGHRECFGGYGARLLDHVRAVQHHRVAAEQPCAERAPRRADRGERILDQAEQGRFGQDRDLEPPAVAEYRLGEKFRPAERMRHGDRIHVRRPRLATRSHAHAGVRDEEEQPADAFGGLAITDELQGMLVVRRRILVGEHRGTLGPCALRVVDRARIRGVGAHRGMEEVMGELRETGCRRCAGEGLERFTHRAVKVRPLARRDPLVERFSNQGVREARTVFRASDQLRSAGFVDEIGQGPARRSGRGAEEIAVELPADHGREGEHPTARHRKPFDATPHGLAYARRDSSRQGCVQASVGSQQADHLA